MQMKVPVVSVNRKALEHTDLLFSTPPLHCVRCDQTGPRERRQGPKETTALFHNFICLVNLLHIEDKNRGRAVDRMGSEATNKKGVKKLY